LIFITNPLDNGNAVDDPFVKKSNTSSTRSFPMTFPSIWNTMNPTVKLTGTYYGPILALVIHIFLMGSPVDRGLERIIESWNHRITGSQNHIIVGSWNYGTTYGMTKAPITH
jgi:hypothetical protein